MEQKEGVSCFLLVVLKVLSKCITYIRKERGIHVTGQRLAGMSNRLGISQVLQMLYVCVHGCLQFTTIFHCFNALHLCYLFKSKLSSFIGTDSNVGVGGA